MRRPAADLILFGLQVGLMSQDEAIEQDLYVRFKTLQRQLEFVEIQVLRLQHAGRQGFLFV